MKTANKSEDLPIAFGNEIAQIALSAIKSDSCLRFSPPQTASGLVCVGDPGTGRTFGESAKRDFDVHMAFED